MDAQPKPGSKSYLKQLVRQLREVQAELLAIGSLDGERVETQVTRCAASHHMWELRSLIAQEHADECMSDESVAVTARVEAATTAQEEARKCSKLALDFSTQQTRAKKYLISDKVDDLEAKVGKQDDRERKLRLVR